MSDRWVVALALAATFGAWAARPVPLWVGGVVTVAAVAALVWRRPGLLVVVVLVGASLLGARAVAGARPVASGAFAGRVTLRTDPSRLGPGVQVEVVAGRRHLDAWAFGSAATALTRRLAGEQVWLEGRQGPAPLGLRGRLAARHVVGRLDVTVVGDSTDGSPAARAANRVRRALARGASALPPTDRSLFLGFVVGDDRDEPPALVDAFRTAGLSHLTAVSGENVAFLLALAGPFLRRLGVRGRWAATLGLIAWFALLTRFEPSVLRAAVMAGLAATAAFLDRPASTVRLLGLAVIAMVLIDPLIVHAAGWWLSVGATAGIALLARPLAARLPGPRALAELLGVTAAAQVGVAPVSVLVFGGLPLLSIPANLLAVPAAGPVMVWGLPAGLAAGFLPAAVGRVVLLPAQLCLRWITVVARTAARRPVVLSPLASAVVVAAVVLLVVLVPPRPGRMAVEDG